jgi:NADPH-dependent 2,4-dienoyl-CoA reductase/sulfur reductase-like enzyme/rhodanese-related sulfurtransferase
VRIIIIGGVAAGMSAATRLRRLQEDAEIIVVERGEHVSFANCGLPYHLGGVISDRSALLLQTPESLAARFRIDVRTRTEATAIHPHERTVDLRLPDGSAESMSYDELILTPGAAPVRPPIPGIEHALVLRDVSDLDRLVDAADGAREAVVIGAGFIGVEVTENLLARGIAVHLVEAADHIIAPLDPEMAEPVQARLREGGVDLRLRSKVVGISPDGVTLDSGETLLGGLVLAAIGVRPESRLAAEAGLEVTGSGAIAVDEHWATTDPHIHAAGDAVPKIDAIGGGPVLVPLANTANRDGRLLADVVSGRPGAARPTLGTAIVGVLGLQVAVTGWSETRLRDAGRPVRVIHIHPVNHAGYFPGATGMRIKLLVDPATDLVLGAQAVAEQGADKRIDVIATAITGGLTASRLADLELAYAPQFGSAKDPVNFLGWADRNIADGLVRTIQWHELAGAMTAGAKLIDVRTAGEHAARAIDGSILIPLDELRDRLDELPEGELIVHCAAGLRSYIAARIIAQHGRTGPQSGRRFRHLGRWHGRERAEAGVVGGSRRAESQARDRKSFSSPARSSSQSWPPLAMQVRTPEETRANPARSTALPIAASWVTISLHSRPSSIIVMTPPIWPWARRRRVMTGLSSSGSSFMGLSWSGVGSRSLAADTPRGVRGGPGGETPFARWP